MSPSQLQEAINNLSQKSHVVSEDAIKAKQTVTAEQQSQMQKNWQLLDEFSKNVSLLASLFSQSRFDEMVLFISNPARIFVVQFAVSVMRGMGFAVGVYLIYRLLLFIGIL